MSKPEQKLVQYLMEARASEDALVRVLQSQIAMTPRGSYRSALERHLEETRRHARRVGERLRTLNAGFNPISTAVGIWEDVFGQTLALGKAPLDLLRGTSGEEKVLKNAKDTCATESLEIATYTAIEQVARRVGDRETAELAADILQDEQRMLAAVMRELPRLADAVVGADIADEPTYDVSQTGAAEAADAAASKLDGAARDTARRARAVPGVAQAEAETNQSLLGEEPWPGYDAQTVADIQARLSDADAARLRAVREYERSHKNRAGVLRAAERRLAA
jgi:ferritin-like metal-binding protein YciE